MSYYAGANLFGRSNWNDETSNDSYDHYIDSKFENIYQTSSNNKLPAVCVSS
ncbi:MULTISPECIES: hypothetical protein [Gilliamella]|uniref:hypothetical protein n=1 Tax=Gilliamella TaxID=1193503 RepID=UPI0013F4C4B0|nr:MULTISPECIES: hypothetical protein [Gilliamella]MBI0113866.1 hypothetical protein [Gilliamella sp. W8123]MBI0118715.1 hypothetical protein [Gilliamella sp. W8129]